MAHDPALRDLITAATAKYQDEHEGRRGIVPLEPIPELDPLDAAIFMVADMINEALTGPAIRVEELAERIVGEVNEVLMQE